MARAFDEARRQARDLRDNPPKGALVFLCIYSYAMHRRYGGDNPPKGALVFLCGSCSWGTWRPPA